MANFFKGTESSRQLMPWETEYRMGVFVKQDRKIGTTVASVATAPADQTVQPVETPVIAPINTEVVTP